jgi:hypothetical protein
MLALGHSHRWAVALMHAWVALLSFGAAATAFWPWDAVARIGGVGAVILLLLTVVPRAVAAARRRAPAAPPAGGAVADAGPATLGRAVRTGGPAGGRRDAVPASSVSGARREAG